MNTLYRAIQLPLACLAVLLVLNCPGPAVAQVQSSGENGFEIRISKMTTRSAAECNLAFVNDIGKWWASDHTWSGNSKNLSIDMDRHVMIEQLPDGGFCSHMVLEHYQPGSLILLTGGLGPLKEMGLNGAMSIRFAEKDGKTSINIKYVVHGYSPNGFDELSNAVHHVVDMQLSRWIAYCETGDPAPK